MAEPESPPKKKKLPFKPTAFRRPAVPPPAASVSPTGNDDSSSKRDDDGADGLALFRRGKEMAPALAADLERRLKKRERQKQAEEERRRSSLGDKRRHDEDQAGEAVANDDADTFADPDLDLSGTNRSVLDDLVTPPPSKRSRNGAGSSGDRVATPIIDLDDSEPMLPQASPSTRTTRSRAEDGLRRTAAAIPAAPILLDSDSEPDTHAVKPLPASRPREPSIEITDTAQTAADDDDEFAEYVRKAEAARARQREQQTAAANGRTSATPSSSSTPNAEILVSSSIPGSVPCKAIVRFDQPFRLLRDSWATKQRKKAGLHIPDSDAILTWRRTRVYNSSTLQHLGIRPLGDGRIAVSSSDGGRVLSRSYSSSTTNEGLSDDRTCVHFEAWTQASFAEMEREEALRKEAPSSSQIDDDPDTADEGDEETAEEEKLRVLLRARGLPDVGLTVRPATTAETLITGFCAQVAASKPDAIPAGTSVQLWFDGEQLEEHVTLEEADIADRDIIEVHLKPA